MQGDLWQGPQFFPPPRPSPLAWPKRPFLPLPFCAPFLPFPFPFLCFPFSLPLFCSKGSANFTLFSSFFSYFALCFAPFGLRANGVLDLELEAPLSGLKDPSFSSVPTVLLGLFDRASSPLVGDANTASPPFSFSSVFLAGAAFGGVIGAWAPSLFCSSRFLPAGGLLCSSGNLRVGGLLSAPFLVCWFWGGVAWGVFEELPPRPPCP